MFEHLNEFNRVFTDLQNLDLEISEEDKVLLLLNSLSDSYECLTTTILYGMSKIRYEEVLNSTMNNEYRKLDKKVY